MSAAAAAGRMARAAAAAAASRARAPLPAAAAAAAVRNHSAAAEAGSTERVADVSRPSGDRSADAVRPVNHSKTALFSWGRGESGALGHASDKNEHHPRQLAFTPILAADEPAHVACGLYHSVVYTSKHAWLWGRGSGGRLGQGDEEWAYEPQHLAVLSEIAAEEGGIRAVTLGGLHSTALMRSGSLWTWGHGGFGALGHGDFRNALVPKRIGRTALHSDVATQSPGLEAPSDVQWASVACGGAHTLALAADGALYSWGRDEGEGRLGLSPQHEGLVLDNAANVPTRVPGVGALVEVAAGGFHSLGRLAGAGVAPGLLGWGGNMNGELGLGSCMSDWEPRAIDELAGVAVNQVAANGFHSAALTPDGEVYTWGHGKEGQLGHGTAEAALVPTKVRALEGERVVQVALGGASTYAVTANGDLLAWGSNRKSQIGLGWWSNDEYAEPQLVRLPGRVIRIAAGAAHALAVVDMA